MLKLNILNLIDVIFAPNMNYALVTGGSSGMGLEYIKLLAQRGYNIIIVALTQGETDAAKDLLHSLYPDTDILSIGIDLSEAGAAHDLFRRIKELRPEAQVEVLVNNAGILYPRHFYNMTGEQVGRIIMVHNYTLSMLCHLFLPQMLERGKGYILNVSSMAASFPYPFISLYAATKSFTKVFTRALRTELIGSGVVVSAIYFGAVSTPLYTLSEKWRNLAIRLGIMITPQKASRIALKMLFAGKSGKTPGLFNKIIVPVSKMLPHRLIGAIDRFVTKHWNFK